MIRSILITVLLMLTSAYQQQSVPVATGANASSAPSYVFPSFSAGCNGFNASGTTASCTLTVASTDALFLICMSNPIGNTLSWGISTSGSVVSSVQRNSGSWSSIAAYVLNPTGGSTTATCTSNSSVANLRAGMMVVHKGSATSVGGAWGAGTTSNISGSSTISSSTYTTTQANSYIMGCTIGGNNGPWTTSNSGGVSATNQYNSTIGNSIFFTNCADVSLTSIQTGVTFTQNASAGNNPWTQFIFNIQ